jgi:crossover junction endodeoxyribonuclease RuvC
MNNRHNDLSQPPHRIILGIDPGLAIVGYAVVVEQSGQLTLRVCDVIRTPAKMLLPQRLLLLYERMTALLSTHRPDEVAIEALFFGKNRSTALTVGHARGVILLALACADLPSVEYTPATVKLAVTGTGGAKKAQVGDMVRRLLNLPAVPRPDDAADAAAIAICHAHMSTTVCASIERKDTN